MIGIIGGYGEVGLEVTRLLKKYNKHSLRIGGRNIKLAKMKLQKELFDVELMQVDVDSDRSVEAFIDGCDLIINCVGPSYNSESLAAKKCFEKKCNYVDLGINKKLESMRNINNDITAIYGAGFMPGLSGILPRWLAQKFHKVSSLTCYTGISDKFTSSAAEDYLAGIFDSNKSLAAWKEGKVVNSCLKRKTNVQLPYFLEEVNLYPYFDKETEYVAESIGIEDGEWYMAFEGENIQSVLEKVCFEFISDKKNAVKHLCMATTLDSIEIGSYVNFLVEMHGVEEENEIVKTLILQMDKPSVLTGTMAALAGMAILEGRVKKGVYPLAEVSGTENLIEKLNEVKVLRSFQIQNYPVKELLRVVEGEI